MLTSDEFDTFTNPIVELYREFEDEIIRDLVRRISNMSFASAGWQVQRLSESGVLYADILKRLAQLTGKSEKTLHEMFYKAGVRSMAFDDALYVKAGLTPLPLNLSPQMIEVLKVGLARTSELFRNLTMTTASAAQNIFINMTDRVYMEISSGAKDYNSAIRQAVKDMAAQGINTVSYGKRVDFADVAVRRAALTGIGQTVGELQMARANEMGTDLIAVSAHIGARNKGVGPMNHESWQGKVYSRSGKRGKYLDFVTETGYGTGEGLSGWNCRHSFYPFFEGISENAYNEATLDDYADKTVKYNGKDIPIYDATQIQRNIERRIRYWKRQVSALEAGGLEHVTESSKIKQWQLRARQFVSETKLQRQNVREQIQ